LGEIFSAGFEIVIMITCIKRGGLLSKLVAEI
jgi:hypothetical protein